MKRRKWRAAPPAQMRRPSCASRVPGAEFGGARLAHVAVEQRNGRGAQIHHDERIERVGEMAVDVEAEKAAAGLKVLPYQNRDAFAVTFEIGNQRGEIVEIFRHVAQGSRAAEEALIRTIGAARRDQIGQGFGAMGFEEFHEQVARNGDGNRC